MAGIRLIPSPKRNGEDETVMTMLAQIQSTLNEALQPIYLTVENESHQHRGPADAETHFKVTCTSNVFAGLSAVKRHQKVYGLEKTGYGYFMKKVKMNLALFHEKNQFACLRKKLKS